MAGDDRKHLERVRQLPCCVCATTQGVQAHHLLIAYHGAMGAKVHDYMSIPLCADHHVGANGIHTLGVQTWERRFDRQMEYLNKTLERLRLIHGD